jgi:hypothetical protein
MVDPRFLDPVPLFRAADRAEPGKTDLILATYLLAVARLSRAGRANPDEIAPFEALDELGLGGLASRAAELGDPDAARFDLRSIETAPQDDIEDDDLAGLVRRVLEAESSLDATLAHYPEILERGLRSPVPVLRIAALAAALLLSDAPSPRLLAGVSWFLARLPELDEVTRAMLGVLVQRVAQPGPGGPPPPAVAASPGTRGAGLVLVHGTHLPFNTPPDWHLPGSGGFHSYVSATRADTYAGQNPYEWEGNWTHRGRQIAGRNLRTWLTMQSLDGADAISHSHGGNVILEAARAGAGFGTTILTACPVHPGLYDPTTPNIGSVLSIRVRMDLVILADGGNQRFPAASGVTEHHVPRAWFWHGIPIDPDVWRAEGYDRFL